MRTCAFVAVLLFAPIAAISGLCQETLDMAKGLSSYAEYVPSDIDNVNPVNGNLFLKIPLVSFPQRGGKLRLNYYIYYNDKQWQAGLTPYTSPVTGAVTAVDGSGPRRG